MLAPAAFAQAMTAHQVPLRPLGLTTLQMNLTKMCNQACLHCHVDSSPRRREAMSDAVLDRCLELLASERSLHTVDLTGGAPELHPRFRSLVRAARALGKRVLVRHNLTVTLDPHPLTKESMAYLPAFFAAEGVELISSLPCYQEGNTDRQRGGGVFRKSIASLQQLNAHGFGGESLQLHLVFNPIGARLPAPQADLEPQFKAALQQDYGIVFNRLYAITNMPIHRFKAQLIKDQGYEAYMELLAAAFNPEAAAGVMCRSLLSVAYDGKLYDCDFNQMLQLPLAGPADVFALTADAALQRQIRVGNHCFGCTAGAGSSCGGNTAAFA